MGALLHETGPPHDAAEPQTSKCISTGLATTGKARTPEPARHRWAVAVGGSGRSFVTWLLLIGGASSRQKRAGTLNLLQGAGSWRAGPRGWSPGPASSSDAFGRPTGGILFFSSPLTKRFG